MKHKFIFSNYNTYLIYASNGTMKTSFAKTFQDIIDEDGDSKITTKDEMFERKTIRKIKKDNKNLNSNELFVIASYNEEYYSENAVSTLVVNEKLRKEYTSIYLELEKIKTQYIKQFKKNLDINNLEEIILELFKKDFYESICQIKNEKINTIQELNYKPLFNKNIIDFFKRESIKKEIKEYIQTYKEILSQSKYFDSNFDYHNAQEIEKKLKNENFFEMGKCKRKILFDEDVIETNKRMNEIINSDYKKLINDTKLNEKYERIDTEVKKYKGIKEIIKFITNNKWILFELEDINLFLKKILIYYSHKNPYQELIYEKYNAYKKQLEQIKKKAKKEQKIWKEVISEFNSRFNVPFEIEIENQTDVILNQKVPVFKYIFKDGKNKIIKEKSELISILSGGEKRALYLLNIIFEIKARIKNKQETLLIVDDIADSFDYNNKYAIVQYLKEIHKNNLFKMIILTHNYDFYRNLQFTMLEKDRWKTSLICINDKKQIILDAKIGGRSVTNPFIKWKEIVKENKDKNGIENIIIACLPFIRNIIEYTTGQSSEYEEICKLLHYKNEYKNLKLGALKEIYHKYMQYELTEEKKNIVLYEYIHKKAKIISKEKNTSELELEKKIILALACRLNIDKYLRKKLNNEEDIETGKLFEKFKEKNKLKEEKIIEKVLISCSETIHLNGFMYEPLIDTGCKYLKDLYKETNNMIKKEE